MCLLALWLGIDPKTPLLVAANRDESVARPSAPPAELDAGIVAGKDLESGGTWLGVNGAGLAAGILNRHLNGQNSLEADARSRGLLCMDLLRCRSALEAGNFLSAERARYNPFTLLFADRTNAFAAYNSEGKIITQKLLPGLHVFSSAAEFDVHSAKAERAYRLFNGETITARIDSGRFDEALTALQGVLSDHTLGPGSDNPGDAICVHRESSGTVSSSVIFHDRSRSRFVTYYCAGAPCRTSFGGALDLDLS